MNLELVHYSREPFTLNRAIVYNQTGFGNGKPDGLWVTTDTPDGWADWCRLENWNTAGLAHRTALTLTPGANVLHLETVEALRAFNKTYAGHPDAGPLSRHYINWAAVADILIVPYQWQARLDLELLWYYGWDVASGCIWNLDALALAEVPA
jgi:hypothetical protein